MGALSLLARVNAMEKKFLSVAEVATILGIHEITAYRWCESGKLPSLRLGGRRLVPVSAIDSLLAQALAGEVR